MAEHPDEPKDSVRYALHEAIREHLDRCGSTVAITPQEFMRRAALKSLGIDPGPVRVAKDVKK